MTFRFTNLPIRTRLIILFTLQIFIMIFVGGVYLDYRLRQTLDDELANKLNSLARAGALQIDGELLTSLEPGDESTRTYRNLTSQIEAFKLATGVRRVYVFSRSRANHLDTEPGFSIGHYYAFLPISDAEVQALFDGEATSSTLFTGKDGKLYKAGFAPVYFQEEIVAALAVEGSADTFATIGRVRNTLMLIGFALLVGAAILGIFFSRTLTTPINRLKLAVKDIERGDYDVPISVATRDEIGYLASTMEEMRRAIVQRDLRQKTMLAGVAHEIRNPLGGIELFTGLLVNELPKGRSKEEAVKIQAEVQNLKKIVSDFLDYARPQRAQKKDCRVSEIFKDVKMLLASELGDIKCRYEEQPANTEIQADTHHLKQIFMNLLKNSAEAMAGVGEIRVAVSQDNGHTVVHVSDTGPGIVAEARERLFEPFFTTGKEGTGLGLAIVKTLVEENGGEIELLPAEKGACFRLRF